MDLSTLNKSIVEMTLCQCVFECVRVCLYLCTYSLHRVACRLVGAFLHVHVHVHIGVRLIGIHIGVRLYVSVHKMSQQCYVTSRLIDMRVFSDLVTIACNTTILVQLSLTELITNNCLYLSLDLCSS